MIEDKLAKLTETKFVVYRAGEVYCTCSRGTSPCGACSASPAPRRRAASPCSTWPSTSTLQYHTKSMPGYRDEGVEGFTTACGCINGWALKDP